MKKNNFSFALIAMMAVVALGCAGKNDNSSKGADRDEESVRDKDGSSRGSDATSEQVDALKREAAKSLAAKEKENEDLKRALAEKNDPNKMPSNNQGGNTPNNGDQNGNNQGGNTPNNGGQNGNNQDLALKQKFEDGVAAFKNNAKKFVELCFPDVLLPDVDSELSDRDQPIKDKLDEMTKNVTDLEAEANFNAAQKTEISKLKNLVAADAKGLYLLFDTYFNFAFDGEKPRKDVVAKRDGLANACKVFADKIGYQNSSRFTKVINDAKANASSTSTVTSIASAQSLLSYYFPVGIFSVASTTLEAKFRHPTTNNAQFGNIDSEAVTDMKVERKADKSFVLTCTINGTSCTYSFSLNDNNLSKVATALHTGFYNQNNILGSYRTRIPNVTFTSSNKMPALLKTSATLQMPGSYAMPQNAFIQIFNANSKKLIIRIAFVALPLGYSLDHANIDNIYASIRAISFEVANP